MIEAYGAAGTILIVLLWVYYAAQILLFGAELTQAYATSHGSGLRLAATARSVTEGCRAEQGLARERPARPNVRGS